MIYSQRIVRVLIVGAGNSACGIALELYRKGIEVTMAVRKATIKPTVKYWIKPDVENRIKSGDIKAYFETTVQEIKANKVLLKTPQGLVELENDPDNADLLNAIFRGFHTVKGGAGFLALNELVEVCHGAENIFDSLTKDFSNFVEEYVQADDITMIALKYLGKDTETKKVKLEIATDESKRESESKNWDWN